MALLDYMSLRREICLLIYNQDWESFVETLTDKIIEADETIPSLPLKDIIFRIYRDM